MFHDGTLNNILKPSWSRCNCSWKPCISDQQGLLFSWLEVWANSFLVRASNCSNDPSGQQTVPTVPTHRQSDRGVMHFDAARSVSIHIAPPPQVAWRLLGSSFVLHDNSAAISLGRSEVLCVFACAEASPRRSFTACCRAIHFVEYCFFF